MSIRIMSQVWDAGPERQADRFVLLALADYCNDAGECWPSIASIAAKTCLKERGVRGILRRLEVEGWLETQVGGGRHGCSKYRINPAPHAPRQDMPPGTTCPTPRHETTQNPAPHAPEPSRTIIEPSDHSARERKAVALPDGWVPSDRNRADALSKDFTDQEIDHEADKFRNHHHAKGTKFKNWDAGWRTWIGNASDYRGRGMAGKASAGGYGQGGGIASIAARRRANGSV